MDTLSVSRIAGTTISRTGDSVSLTFGLDTGAEQVIEFPYAELDRVTQLLMALAARAYVRQVEHGRIPAINPLPQELCTIRGSRVLIANDAVSAALQLVFQAGAKGPLTTLLFQLTTDVVHTLCCRLQEAEEEIRQRRTRL